MPDAEMIVHCLLSASHSQSCSPAQVALGLKQSYRLAALPARPAAAGGHRYDLTWAETLRKVA